MSILNIHATKIHLLRVH